MNELYTYLVLPLYNLDKVNNIAIVLSLVFCGLSLCIGYVKSFHMSHNVFDTRLSDKLLGIPVEHSRLTFTFTTAIINFNNNINTKFFHLLTYKQRKSLYIYPKANPF